MPAHLQPHLPPLASEYQSGQIRRIDEALAEIEARWRLFGNRFDVGWNLIRPRVLAEIQAAQFDLASSATDFVPNFMEQTHQRVATDGVADPTSLVGLSGAGLPIADELDWTPVRAKQAIAEGKSPTVAREVAGQYLIAKSMTILSDTARSAESVGMATHRSAGFVRVVNSGACVRCVVLAGKWFKYNQGFLRHPRCHCYHVPAPESLGSHWQSDPHTYFHSLTEDQQVKLMGSRANAQAVREGADVAQVANIYRKTSGLEFAQESGVKRVGGLKFTTEGTTRRGIAGQQQAGLRRNGPQQMRPTPETITVRASSIEERQQLMRLYGYIVDNEAAARGRAVLAEARRRERNAQRAARRQGSLPESRRPATGAPGGSGGKPPAGPIQSGAMDAGDSREEIADQLMAAAVAAEPAASRAVRSAADVYGGTVERFDSRFKTRASVLEKLELRGTENLSKFNDALRYTVVLDDSTYWRTAENFTNFMESLGFVADVRPRTWRRTYTGLNYTYLDPEGRPFEVQLHTRASLEMAEATHSEYEAYRKLDPESAEGSELRAQLIAQFDTVPRPPR